MYFVKNRKLLILIKLAKKGNDWAFTNLVRNLEKDVFRFAYGILGNADDCHDVVQNVFIKVYFALANYEEGKAKFTTWLFVVTRNECLNFLRKNRLRYSELEESMAKSSFENEAVLKNDLFLALSSLPVAMKEAFLLVAIQGFSYQEAAEVLKTSPGTVKSRVHNARLKLLKKMDLAPEKEMSLNEV